MDGHLGQHDGLEAGSTWENGGNFEQTIRLLLEYKVDVNAVDDFGNTALSWLVAHSHEGLTQLLLKSNADPNIGVGTAPDTPLTHAAKRGYAHIVTLLFEYGADPNGVTLDDRKPVFLARKNGHPVVADMLKNCGGEDQKFPQRGMLNPTHLTSNLS